jgi:hypothetical protein
MFGLEEIQRWVQYCGERQPIPYSEWCKEVGDYRIGNCKGPSPFIDKPLERSMIAEMEKALGVANV